MTEKKKPVAKDEKKATKKTTETTYNNFFKDLEKAYKETRDYFFDSEGKCKQADIERMHAGFVDIIAGGLGLIGTIFKELEKAVNKCK